MRRHYALQPLSRQHHHILLAVLLLEKGIARHADLEVMVQFWRKVFLEHVLPKEKIEELLLHQVLKEFAPRQYEIFCKQCHELHALLDHAAPGSYELLAKQVSAVKQHVRDLERIYYPTVEPHLTAELCDALTVHCKVLNEACVQPAIKFYKDDDMLR